MSGHSEQQIELIIMNYLNSIGGYVIKINPGGKPIQTPGGIKLIPFKSRYSRKGMSDILYIRFGKLYAFEVKTVSEHNYIKRNLDKILKANYFNSNKKYKHIKNQYEFLKSIRDNGGVGGFVSSIENVREYLNDDG